jgi:hypothetical protein
MPSLLLLHADAAVAFIFASSSYLVVAVLVIACGGSLLLTGAR